MIDPYYNNDMKQKRPVNAAAHLAKRKPEEVFEDHLRCAKEWDLESDLMRNISKDIVLLTNFGVFKGHDGVREAAQLLSEELPKGQFTYNTVLCHEKMLL